ncbi:TAL effector repeat-containing protein [Mycetohabitans sp. B46]
MLSRVDLLKIASYECAAQALQAVLEHGPILTQAGRSNREIVKVASCPGSASQLCKMAAGLQCA